MRENNISPLFLRREAVLTIFYAKSHPVETIKEHTDQLLKRLHEFKKIYQSKIKLLSERDWELLEIAVKYHDR